MLGGKSIHLAACVTGNFVGADCGITEDLTSKGVRANDLVKKIAPLIDGSPDPALVVRFGSELWDRGAVDPRGE